MNGKSEGEEEGEKDEERRWNFRKYCFYLEN